MSLILVIGGYGGFGSRLCRWLAKAGHRLIVAGRSAARAARFCAGVEGAEPLELDRSTDLTALLDLHRPDLVIDAAGPFQGSGYQVAEACIRASVPYLDLADARSFVAGIGVLDGRARSAGVAIVAGASSAPALTGAVARELARGLDRVHSIDIALSAANRADGGEAVIAAILSYVGRPVRLWRSGRWIQATGWHELRREDFLFADGSGLKGRRVALADLPDHDLLPGLFAGRPAVTFRAGTELGFQMWALWLASWLVRWQWLHSLEAARRWFVPLYKVTAGWGGKRSAMSVTLAGKGRGQAIERRWTIVAEQGQGLEIPVLTAQILAADILGRRLQAGAYSAESLLCLDRYEECFSQLPVRHETRERRLPPSLYRRLLGPAFERLPEPVRAIHDICRDAGAIGEGTVIRGRSATARMIASIMGFPPEGSWPLHVAFHERSGVETWTRDFGGHRFSSRLSKAGSLLVERFGPLRFAFSLPAGANGLEMRLVRWSAFRIPLPAFLAPRISAREWAEQGRFRFAVAVTLPLVGDVVRYDGWLISASGPGSEEGRPVMDRPSGKRASGAL